MNESASSTEPWHGGAKARSWQLLLSSRNSTPCLLLPHHNNSITKQHRVTLGSEDCGNSQPAITSVVTWELIQWLLWALGARKVVAIGTFKGHPFHRRIRHSYCRGWSDKQKKKNGPYSYFAQMQMDVCLRFSSTINRMDLLFVCKALCWKWDCCKWVIQFWMRNCSILFSCVLVRHIYEISFFPNTL